MIGSFVKEKKHFLEYETVHIFYLFCAVAFHFIVLTMEKFVSN